MHFSCTLCIAQLSLYELAGCYSVCFEATAHATSCHPDKMNTLLHLSHSGVPCMQVHSLAVASLMFHLHLFTIPLHDI